MKRERSVPRPGSRSARWTEVGWIGGGLLGLALLAGCPARLENPERFIHDGGCPDVEVEIFNAEVWDAPPDQTAATVSERFAAVLGE